MTIGIILIWIIQVATMAAFDTRVSTINQLLNWSALITGAVFTYLALGVWWLLVPVVVLPIISGIIGGTLTGLVERNKRKK